MKDLNFFDFAHLPFNCLLIAAHSEGNRAPHRLLHARDSTDLSWVRV